GDQDMKISYVGTLEWIKMLNVSTVEDWRPWFVNGQVAGYTTKFSNDRYHVTFATVKGAGHTAPEYKRLECFTMLLKCDNSQLLRYLKPPKKTYPQGPLIFNTSACDWHSKSPTYQLNPFSWTKIASIIFLDSPVGTGFSYAKNPGGYYTDDITSSRRVYQFLSKWLVDHGGFISNPLYISGDSYCGRTVPIIVQEISNGNKVGIQPVMNLQGYILGNPSTQHEEEETKSKYDYAHRVSLLSDELYESTKVSCNRSCADKEVDDVKCAHNLQAVSYNLDRVFAAHVLKPKCISNQTWCQESIYQLLYYWANNIQVQAALHIQKGTKPYWIRCNSTLAYTHNVGSSFSYHQNFTQKPIRALIYSGDQDMVVSYVTTLGWIKMLNVSIAEDWRPWFVNGQVAGCMSRYTTRFSNGNYHLTYATVKLFCERRKMPSSSRIAGEVTCFYLLHTANLQIPETVIACR
ncbi:hypothetical protein SOVF_064210 isoform C, partial [Spinacia oleracea]